MSLLEFLLKTDPTADAADDIIPNQIHQILQERLKAQPPIAEKNPKPRAAFWCFSACTSSMHSDC